MQKIKKISEKHPLEQAVTLIELIMVVIIIGVIAGFAVPKYTRAREKTIDNRTKAILGLMRAAEMAYAMENGGAYFSNTCVVATINSRLNLDLFNDDTWFSMCIYNNDPPNNFTASLRRNKGGYDRTWSIDALSTNATCTGSCP